MIAYKLRGSFICNNCLANCKTSDECINDIEALYPRKQQIGCLGEFCDSPCELQKESDLTIEALVTLTKFLGGELNKYLLSSIRKKYWPQELKSTFIQTV